MKTQKYIFSSYQSVNGYILKPQCPLLLESFGSLFALSGPPLKLAIHCRVHS